MPGMRTQYHIALSKPIEGKAWVGLADTVQNALSAAGFDAWGINNQEIDRDFMLLKSDLSTIEGSIAGGSDVEAARREIIKAVTNCSYEALTVTFAL